MGQIKLSENNTLKVHAETPDSGKTSDLEIMKVAFRATPGSKDISKLDKADGFTTSLGETANILALWATGFEWDNNSLTAVVNTLLPLAQRRNIYRVTREDAKTERPQISDEAAT